MAKHRILRSFRFDHPGGGATHFRAGQIVDDVELAPGEAHDPQFSQHAEPMVDPEAEASVEDGEEEDEVEEELPPHPDDPPTAPRRVVKRKIKRRRW